MTINCKVFYLEHNSQYPSDEGWYFKVHKDLGGGYTATSRGGPFESENKAKLECAWVRNRLETYEE